MSRSRKKPFWTQGYKGVWRKSAKKRANNKTKQVENIKNGNSYKKEFNSWDICDWSFHDPKNPKAYRK